MFYKVFTLTLGQVETEETENGNGKLKRKSGKLVVVVRNINGIERALS